MCDSHRRLESHGQSAQCQDPEGVNLFLPFLLSGSTVLHLWTQRCHDMVLQARPLTFRRKDNRSMPLALTVPVMIASLTWCPAGAAAGRR